MRLDSRPFAVVDLETSGSAPHADAILEVAVVHLGPNETPRLALDTLVDSQGPFGFGDVHGIRQADLHGAPNFYEIAGELWNVCAGRVVVAHSAASCEIAFLAAAFHRCGMRFEPPYLCTMSLDRAMGSAAHNRDLDELAAGIGLGRSGCHVASEDAALTAWVLEEQLRALDDRGLHSIEQLAALRPTSRSFASLARPSITPGPALRARRRSRSRLAGVLNRADFQGHQAPSVPVDAACLYAVALRDAFADWQVEPAELEMLRALRAHVDDGTARVIHAGRLWELLGLCARDGHVDEDEMERLDHAAAVLRELGWMPGSGPTVSGG